MRRFPGTPEVSDQEQSDEGRGTARPLDESGEWQRAVTSCGTGSDGLAVETFILYPAGEDGPSRIELAADDEI
jgi:hypothetical protein